MMRPIWFAALLALSACDLPTAPERSNPLDPGWPVELPDLEVPANLRLASATAASVTLAWDFGGEAESIVVGRLYARSAADLPASWTTPEVVATLPAGSSSFTDHGLAAPGAACYRVWTLAPGVRSGDSNTVCVGVPTERRDLPGLAGAQFAPMGLSLDGRTVFVEQDGVFAWDVASDTRLGTFPGAARVVRALDSGGALLVGTADGLPRVWQVMPDRVIGSASLSGSGGCGATTWTASADGRVIAGVCGQPATARVWDATSGALLDQVPSSTVLDVSPDGSRVLLAVSGGLAMRTVGSGAAGWSSLLGTVRLARFGAGGETVLAIADGTLSLLAAASGAQLAERPTAGGSTPLTVSRDGERAIVPVVSPANPLRLTYAVVSARSLEIERLVGAPLASPSAVIDGERGIGIERGGARPPRVEWLVLGTPWQEIASPGF